MKQQILQYFSEKNASATGTVSGCTATQRRHIRTPMQTKKKVCIRNCANPKHFEAKARTQMEIEIILNGSQHAVKDDYIAVESHEYYITKQQSNTACTTGMV